MSECVFCKIVEGTQPAEVWSRSEYAMVIRPLNPVTPGHLLVIPKEHAEVLDQLSAKAAVAAIGLVMATGRSLRSDYNLIQSNGPAATQTVPHVHFHLIPRTEGDGLKLPWTNPHNRHTKEN